MFCQEVPHPIVILRQVGDGTSIRLSRKSQAKSPCSGGISRDWRRLGEEDTCEIAILWVLEYNAQKWCARTSQTKSQFSGGWKCDRRIFSEEVPREIAILRSQEKFSGRSERRPESIFGGSPKRNCDSPVATPFGDYNIKGDDRRTGESRFRLILPPKKLSGRPSERPENLSRDRRMAISRGTSS